MIHKYVTYLDSPIGVIGIFANEIAITSISFMDSMDQEHPNVITDEAKEELLEYFEGTRKIFNVKTEQPGTLFQQEVWTEVNKVRYGKTASYGDVAKAIGNPGSIRAVGGANGLNRIPIIIPCHRIIGSDRSFVGYTGGLDKKTFLLELESELKQLKLF